MGRLIRESAEQLAPTLRPVDPRLLEPFPLFHPFLLQPVSKADVVRGEVLDGEAPRVDVKPVSCGLAEGGDRERLPHVGRLVPPVASLVGDGQDVDGADVGGLAEVLDRRDEALGPGVQLVLGLGPVVGGTPFLRLGELLRGVTGGFREGDEPCLCISTIVAQGGQKKEKKKKKSGSSLKRSCTCGTEM